MSTGQTHAAPLTDVVIGAGSGMGAAAAARLAGTGRRLLLADRDLEAAQVVANSLNGDEVVAQTCDIADAAAVGDLVAATGTLGRLIVTAGLSPNMADGRRIMEINLVAMDGLVRQFERVIGRGSVAVVFASMAARSMPADPSVDALIDDPASPAMIEGLETLGLLSHPGLAYAVSKRGVVRMVERRAGTWGAAGARLVSVSPGIINTPMGRLEAANEPAMADMVANSALRREGRPEEVAAVAVFLASEAASFITGTDVLVDGGEIAAQVHPA
jgi:NAD(P)-dependent dehydrogenase (short-subunit alcohol dehydrogenase family)